MLDLIVEPPVCKVNGVSACGVVGRRYDLTDVKRSTLGLDFIIKLVEIVSRMIRYDGNEAMDIGKEFGKDKIGNCVTEKGWPNAWNKQQRGREQNESADEKGSKNLAEEIGRVYDLLPSGFGLCLGHEHRSHGNGLLGLEILRQWLALTLPLGNLQFLERIGRIVEPFPNGHEESSDGVFERPRNIHLTEEFQIAFHEVRIERLA